MTTQVLITTKMGIAIASDSVLTVSLDGNESSRKSLGNSRKIHELGGDHKVLALSSGDASLNNIPIELHVLRWAKGLNDPLPKVRDYAESFLNWLARNPSFSKETDERAVLKAAGRLPELVFDNLQMEIAFNETFESMPSVWDEEFNKWFAAHPNEAKQYLKHLRLAVDKTLKDLPGYWEYPLFEESAALKIVNSKLAKVAIDEWFTDKAMPAAIRQKLASELPSSLKKRFGPEDSSTTLLFAGYGEDAFTPQVVTVVIEGALPEIVFGWIKTDIQDGIDGATIYFPAQNRSIKTFLRGFDPALLESSGEFVSTIIEAALASKEVRQEVKESLSELSKNYSLKWALTLGLEEHLATFGSNKFSKLIDTLGAMDLTGVAEVAESLTGLEILAAHNDDNPPSSGGVIEVVTIDLQYGIQWQRRIPRVKSGLGHSL